jgi:hypothetical protein
MSPKQRAFLAAFEKSATIIEASKKARISRNDHRAWLKDPEYAAAFADARETACELLEGIARRRASRARKPSDLLLIFLLKGMNPTKYRDNAKVELGSSGGGPLQIEVTFVKPNGDNGE